MQEFRLPKGITGVANDTPLSDKSFTRFRLACNEAARRANGRAAKFVAAGITPNFHQATIRRFEGEERIVVCNAAFELVAVATVANNAKLDFTDDKDLAKSFKLLGYKVLDSALLGQPLTAANCFDLDEPEMTEIKYWKCASVGEVIFNWFD